MEWVFEEIKNEGYKSIVVKKILKKAFARVINYNFLISCYLTLLKKINGIMVFNKIILILWL